MVAMKAPPPSTKTNLTARLNSHARTHWPSLANVTVRFRANVAYIDAHEHDGISMKLCRLRYGGSAHLWGFALYRASHDNYEDSHLPTGTPTGTAEEALDCARGLYLTNPLVWLADTPTN